MLQYARILIVDDSGITRKIVRQMLAQNGYRNVDEAANGEEALALLNKISFALVISDWNMSPISGIELLAAMRQSSRLSKIPFIMATAKAQRRFASVARDNGATHYLVKPVTAAMLMERLGELSPASSAA